MFWHNFRTKAWNWRLLLACVSVNLALTLPGGFVNAVLNAPTSIIKTWCNESALYHYNVTFSERQLNNLWSAVVSVFFVGGLVGALNGKIADRIGRKGGLVLSGSLFLIGAFLALSSKILYSFEILMLSRLISGYATGLTTAILPVYLNEITPPELRGATGAFATVGFSLGILLAQVLGFKMILGTEEHWHYLLSAYIPLILLASCAVPFLPESPKYLLSKGYNKKAREEMFKLSQLPMVNDLNEKESNVQDWSFTRVIKDRNVRPKLILTCWIMIGQQFAGTVAVFNYSMKIFQEAGFSELQSQYANLLTGCNNSIIALLVVYIIKIFPRRTVLITSSCCVITSLTLLSTSIALKGVYFWMPYLSIFSIISFIISNGMGLGPIPFFLGSELFDLGPRSAVMALGSFGNWLAALIVSHTFLELNLIFGPVSFLFYAGQLFILTLYIIHSLPETNSKFLNIPV